MKVFVVAMKIDISHTYFVHETPSAQFQHTSLMVVVSPVVPSVGVAALLLGVVLGELEQSSVKE